MLSHTPVIAIYHSTLSHTPFVAIYHSKLIHAPESLTIIRAAMKISKILTYIFPIHIELYKCPEWTLFYLHEKV